MSNIVISYRRSDTEAITGRIFDFLARHYGADSVFMDIEKLRFGPDYRKGVEDAIKMADIMVVVVGPNWLAKDEFGKSRIMQDDDPVRSELETAYHHNIPIFPVRIRPITTLQAQDLPPSLSQLVFGNAPPLDTGLDFRADMARIIKGIDSALGKAPSAVVTEDAPLELVADDDKDRLDEEAIFFPTGSRHSLAERIEAIARRRGPVELSTITIIAGFLLSFLSQSFGLGWLTYDTGEGVSKQIGFLFAPNWTIVYVILFPPYVAIFSLFVGRTRLALKDFCDKGVLVNANGSPVQPTSIFLMWNRALADLSLIFWIGVVIVTLQTVTEWYLFCFRPLTLHSLGEAGVDWTKLALVQPENTTLWWSELIFSGIAYAYMGFALFIYLIILMYEAAFAYFLDKIAYHSGRYRLILRDEVLGDHFAALATQAYGCAALGLAAAICMRAQAEYIKSEYSIITDLLFSDFRAIFRWITNTKESVPPPKSVHIPSEWTSFIELIFTLFLLYLVIYSLYNAFQKARKNYLNNIESSNWRSVAKVSYNNQNILFVRKVSFLRTVLPRHGALNFILIGEVMSYLFMGYGSIGVFTLLFAVFRFILLPALERRRNTEDLQWSSSDPGASMDGSRVATRSDFSALQGEDRS